MSVAQDSTFTPVRLGPPSQLCKVVCVDPEVAARAKKTAMDKRAALMRKRTKAAKEAQAEARAKARASTPKKAAAKKAPPSPWGYDSEEPRRPKKPGSAKRRKGVHSAKKKPRFKKGKKQN